ncbi:hypothetical protein GQ53DRAFT_888049 [Thozetella sp. PMI_491]|nr:hypothetical protein GQ53DRAFT_888049 [Thozetella sp. PMI_491]
MVGVPGRSKACLTCRRRRKGCDLERPACNQCRKAGLDCQGYASQRVFVVSTPSNRRAGYSTSISSLSSISPFHFIERNQNSGDIKSFHLMARPELERRCMDLFWEAYFPSGQPIPPYISRSYTCGWTDTAQNLYREDDSLRSALLANCLLMLGRRCGTLWMLREGLKLYGKALSGLRKSLGICNGFRRDSSIATVKLLSMFEAFSRKVDDQAVEEPMNWQQHHAGELALFLARSPAAHVKSDAHHLFADERVEMALSALLSRKRLVLSNPEWKSVPWQEIPKDLKDVLVDVLVEMPGLLEDLDNTKSCAEPGKQAILQQRLIQRCWEHDRQLLHWFGLVCGGENPSKHPFPESTTRDAVTYVAVVHGMSLFWTTCIILYDTLSLASEPNIDLPEHADPGAYIGKLADALSILLKPGSGLYGRQSAVLLIEYAIQYITTSTSLSRKNKELLGVFRDLKDGLANGPLHNLHGIVAGYPDSVNAFVQEFGYMSEGTDFG